MNPNQWAANSLATVEVALLVAAAEFAAGVLVCYLVQTVRFYRRGETAVGILCTLCLVLGGGGLMLGVPLALLFGWLNARRWGTRCSMWLFTGLFAAAAVNVAAAFAVQTWVTPELWAGWFG